MQRNPISVEFIESLWLFKFGKKEYIEKIPTEGLRFRDPDEYKKSERGSGLINDEHDSEIFLDLSDCKMAAKIDGKYKELNDLKICIKKPNAIESYKICCFSIPKIEIISKTEEETIFKLSSEYIQDIKNNFPDYDAACMIPRHDLEKMFEKRLAKVKYAPVKYFNDKSMNFSDIIRVPNEETIFHKHISFDKQREYRIAIFDYDSEDYFPLDDTFQPVIWNIKNLNELLMKIKIDSEK